MRSTEAAKDRPLDRLVGALGIRGVGSTIAALLVEHFRSVDAIARASQAELEQINGLGPHIASAIVEWFGEERNRALIEKFRRAGVRLEQEPAAQPVSDALAGMTFVLTGTLPTLTRAEAEALITEHGGRVTSSVSQRTSYVVVGAEPGSKLRRRSSLASPAARG